MSIESLATATATLVAVVINRIDRNCFLLLQIFKTFVRSLQNFDWLI